jgi:CRISPR/Cas system endoribonuclease Cas6 (RAMP superfamily)
MNATDSLVLWLSFVMRYPNETFRSLGVTSPSFQERHVLDALGTGLRKAYGEPVHSALPPKLHALVERLEAKELRRQPRRERKGAQ